MDLLQLVVAYVTQGGYKGTQRITSTVITFQIASAV